MNLPQSTANERLAYAVAAADARYNAAAELDTVARQFCALLESGRFLPDAAAFAAARRVEDAWPICGPETVLSLDDDTQSIFEALKTTALLRKKGGSAGVSFSRMRAAGTPVGVNETAAGPAAFRKLFSLAQATVHVGTRGQSAALLSIDHPDIEAFLQSAPQEEPVVVGITSAFLTALKEKTPLSLMDPFTRLETARVDTEQLFVRLRDLAAGGHTLTLVFLPRMQGPADWGKVSAITPCGGQPLLPNETCALGSLDVSKMLDGTHGKKMIDYDALQNNVHTAVHFLDNLVDIQGGLFDAARATRKIGLGITGFADALTEMGVGYATPLAVQLASGLMAFCSSEARIASAELAAARGAYPLYTRERGLPQRNAWVTALAPCVLVANEASQGCMPREQSAVSVQSRMAVLSAFSAQIDGAAACPFILGGKNVSGEVETLLRAAIADTNCKTLTVTAPEAEAETIARRTHTFVRRRG